MRRSALYSQDQIIRLRKCHEQTRILNQVRNQIDRQHTGSAFSRRPVAPVMTPIRRRERADRDFQGISTRCEAAMNGQFMITAPKRLV